MSIVKDGWATVGYYWSKFAAWIWWLIALLALAAVIGSLITLATKGAAGPPVALALLYATYAWLACIALVLLAGVVIGGLFVLDLGVKVTAKKVREHNEGA